MLGIAGEQVERMTQQGQDGFERGSSTARAAGQIQDEALAVGSAEASAERGVGGLGKAGGAHAFGYAVDEAVTDRAGGLGRDVARSNSGAASGDDEAGADRGGADCVLDGPDFVWY